MTNEELDKLAKTLELSGYYKTIKKFVKQPAYHEDINESMLIGAYIDIETTGLNSSSDKIIELAIVTFEFLPDGRIFKILDEYDEFEDPGFPIPQEIVSITGITDQMVDGKKLNKETVNNIIEPVAVVIAHNANFDRQFLENYFPPFVDKAWACSMRDIAWHDESIKLEYIAFKFGFYYEGHRAINDCLAGIHVLSKELPNSKESPLKVMLDNARNSEYRIWAERSPFDTKDILKSRGYRWNNGENNKPKSWYIDVPSERMKKEVGFLHKEIYGSEVVLNIDIINAFNRYSNRI